MRPIVARLSFGVLGILASLLLQGGAAYAADPPGRIGRLSFTEGTVSYHLADQDRWSPAVLNYPVTSGTSLWTEPGARAEIQTGGASVRLDHATQLDVARLDDGGTQLQVNQGTVSVQVSRVPRGGLSVATPHGEAVLLQPGRYRIDVAPPPGNAPPEQSQITVLEGAARISQGGADFDLRSGESAAITGDPERVVRRQANATPIDDWALQRERRLAAAASTRYVSSDIPGYQDLDQNGRWRTVQDLGPVWYPTAVPAGWAPYRYGHWAFVPPWGWTWIDDAPWGFAPFHYGRWVQDDHGWGWYPGPVYARPVYAPALVAFVGGAGWGVSLASGPAPAVGWLPLAPREAFRPYYRTSINYVRNVNITQVNQTVINNVTVNRNLPGTAASFANRRAATVVPAAEFTRAAKVQQATLAVPPQQLAAAPVTRQITHLQPTELARAGSAPPAAVRAAAPGVNTPATVASRPVTERAARAADPEAAPAKAPGPAIPPPTTTTARPERPRGQPPATASGGTAQRGAQPGTATARGAGLDAGLSRIAPAAGPIAPREPERTAPADPRRQRAAPAPGATPGPSTRPSTTTAPASIREHGPATPPPGRKAAIPARPNATTEQAPPRQAPSPSAVRPAAPPAPPPQPSRPAVRAEPPRRAPAPTARVELPRQAPPAPVMRTEPPRPAAPPPVARHEPPRPTPPPPVRAQPPRPPPPAARVEPPRPAPPPPAAAQRGPAKPEDEKRKQGG